MNDMVSTHCCECGSFSCKRRITEKAYVAAEEKANELGDIGRQKWYVRHPDCAWVDPKGSKTVFVGEGYKLVEDGE